MEQLAVSRPNLQQLNLGGNENCFEDLKRLHAIVYTYQNLEGLNLGGISLGTSLFCFFSHLFFFPAILFLITYYAQYFAQNLPILLSINRILLEYLMLKTTCDCYFTIIDCSIRVSRSLVANILLISFCVTALLEHLDLFHAKCSKFLFFRIPFTKIVPIMPAFCSLLKNLLAKLTCP